MGLFKKRSAQPAPAAPTIAESLEGLIETAGQPSLFAHSEFVKQVDCPRCGALKQLPSKTAYLYCDHCGSLIDYDFRLANSGTNAGLTGFNCAGPGGRPPGTPRWPKVPSDCVTGYLAAGPAGNAKSRACHRAYRSVFAQRIT